MPGSTSAEYHTPAALVDVLDRLRVLQNQAEAAVSGMERAGWLAGLREVIDTAEVIFTDVLARFDSHGDAPMMSGQRDATAWLHHELRLSAGDARARVHLARQGGLLTEPMRSVRAGELRFDHLRAISTALRPLQHDPAQQRAAVPVLHDLAASTDPAVVRRVGRRIRDVVDPEGELRERDRQFERRYLAMSPLLDGMTALEGVLDTEGAATLSAALAPLLVPTDASDIRSTGQRRADALIDLASLALRSEQLPELSGTVAAVDIVVAADALIPGMSVGGTATDSTDPSLTTPRGGVVHNAPGGPVELPIQTVRRMLCDATVGRVLLGADSAPLELGRRVRLFTKDQRRALTVRDAGCRFPGCTRPPRYTDAHHLVPWEQGGSTDVSNALLLCRWHHNRTHRPSSRGGWGITLHDSDRGTNGVLTFTGPAGQRVRSEPRAGP
jgi:hypothetical protein